MDKILRGLNEPNHEVTFYQDRLNQLLMMAKHLEISNISENLNFPESEEESPKERKKIIINRPESDEVKLDDNFETETDSEDI